MRTGWLGYQVRVGTAFWRVCGLRCRQSDCLVYPDAVAGQEYVFWIEAYNEFGIGPHAQLSGFSNAPPDLVNPGSQVSAVGEAVALQLQGTDRYGELISYDASGLPPGLTLTPSTGLIAGAGTTAGVYPVTTTVFDGLFSTQRSFTGPRGNPPPSRYQATTQPTYRSFEHDRARGTAAINSHRVLTCSTAGGNGNANLTTATTWQIQRCPGGGEKLITSRARCVELPETA